MSSGYNNTSKAGAIRISPCNYNIKKRRKLIFHLFNCLLCGQVISVEKTLNDERVMALDGLGQGVHICPSTIACPYCYPSHQQSPRRGFFRT
jgi:hypothetical protein